MRSLCQLGEPCPALADLIRPLLYASESNRSKQQKTLLQELTYTVTNSANRKEKLKLLDSVNGFLLPGCLTALMCADIPCMYLVSGNLNQATRSASSCILHLDQLAAPAVFTWSDMMGPRGWIVGAYLRSYWVAGCAVVVRNPTPGLHHCRGPSGSGKTTLLDILAGRKTVGRITGSLLFSGQAPTKTFLRRYTGYTEQARPSMNAGCC